MTVTTARWLCWIALVLLLPLPLLEAGDSKPLAVLPLLAALNQTCGLPLFYWLQCGVWALLLPIFSWYLGGANRDWPLKLRGSLFGLTAFTALVLLSSVALYRPACGAGESISFLRLYAEQTQAHPAEGR